MPENACLLMVAPNQAGNYRFLAVAGRPFSGGAAANEGYDLVHARFERPMALEAGLVAAKRHVVAAGRPVQAIAGIELRIPEPLSMADFDTFNQGYVSILKSLGLEVDGLLPAARTNVAPVTSGVSEPSVYAISYTVPGHRGRQAFVLSGVPEPEPGDPAAMLESIVGVMSTRMQELGVSWDDSTVIQVYGIDEFHGHLVDKVLTRAGQAAVHGIQWFPSLPPIDGLRLEIDARSAGTELVLPMALLSTSGN